LITIHCGDHESAGAVGGRGGGDHHVRAGRRAAPDRRAASGRRWSFEQVFGPSITPVRALSAKPLVLAEIGSAEQGGDKAAWITDFFARLAVRPEVRGFLWFNHDKEADWRVQSSDASRIAYAAGISASRYV